VCKHVKRFLMGESGENPFAMAGGIVIALLLLAGIFTVAKGNLNGSLTGVGTGMSTAASTASSALSSMTSN